MFDLVEGSKSGYVQIEKSFEIVFFNTETLRIQKLSIFRKWIHYGGQWDISPYQLKDWRNSPSQASNKIPSQ